MENLTAEQKQKALFLNLVLTFQHAAFQQMGKLPNPMTNKIERDLDQARMSIDMLDMLKVRTAGHLSEDETRMLDHILRELKLNFVDELGKDKEAPPASTDAATSSGESTARAEPSVGDMAQS